MIFGFFWFFSCYSQNPTVDSLKLVLQNPKLHDTTRLGIVDQIMANASKRSPEAIQYNALMGEIASRNLKNKKLSKQLRDTYYHYLAYYYCDKAVNMLSVKESREALGYIDKAIAIFSYLKDEESLWATITNKGSFLRKIGAHKEAIDCYYKALKHQEAAGNILGAGSTTACIAQVYDDQGNLPMTILYYLKAKEAFDKTKNLNADTLYEKAVLLHNLGFAYYKSGNYEAAEKYLLQARELDLENEFYAQLGFTYDKLGNIYMKQKKYNAALKMFNLGIGYAEKERAKANLLESIGELYFIQKQYGKAA
ncbi:MAG TPA: tetratricopeptide repeat protein, partial [Flavobacterium sp.]|nr:tetratricopeptide repeat protein [Flavobacterium sp.]